LVHEIAVQLFIFSTPTYTTNNKPTKAQHQAFNAKRAIFKGISIGKVDYFIFYKRKYAQQVIQDYFTKLVYVLFYEANYVWFVSTYSAMVRANRNQKNLIY
jgi:predicted solute-binding protein